MDTSATDNYSLRLDGCDLTDDDLIPEIVQGKLICIVPKVEETISHATPEDVTQGSSQMSGVSPLSSNKGSSSGGE